MTLIELFDSSVSSFSNNVLIYEKKEKEYTGITYRQVQDKVKSFAAGLLTLGVKKGDRIALMAEGRADWVVSELAILYTGAVNIPMSVKLTEPDEMKFRLVHSGAKVMITSANQVKKVRLVKEQIPALEKIIILDDIENPEQKEVLFSNILDAGKDFLIKKPDELESRKLSVQPNDYANICYTSGTTADPKGIILTHRNYTSNIEQSLSIISVPSNYTTLLILPWDHAFAHTSGIYTMVKVGASFAAVQTGKTPNETLKNIPVNIKEIKPHFLLSVPALAKNFRKNIEKGIRDKGKVAETLFKAGLKIAYFYNGNGFNKGRGFKIILKPLVSFFDTILFSKVREGFGGRLQFFVGGGALLDIELQRFFYAIGIPMYQGYGLTEASPVISSNNPDIHKMGSSGIIVKYMDCIICDEHGSKLPAGEKGEIVIRGENVMAGYWNNEEATKDSIKGEWLHTGDLGYFDKDGFLYVLGRYKSLLIADDGEKFSPEGIEEAFSDNSDIIEDCMLYNNQNPYTILLLYPNKEALKRRLKHNHIIPEEPEAVEEALKLIEHDFNQYRTGHKYENMFPQRWLPAAIGILPEGFTEENHMINSTLKMVRGKITGFYQKKIDFLYTPEGKSLYNKQNREIIKQLIS